jgi:hypothetical protein
MATLDYTGDSVSGAVPPDPFLSHVFEAPLYRRLTVADIIAADATMTTNGYITADDIIQALWVDAGYVLLRGLFRVITAGTASATGEVGLAGGAEVLGATPFALDAAAGSCYFTGESESYDNGHVFTAVDTIDFQVGTANLVIGDYELFIFGKQLLLGS